METHGCSGGREDGWTHHTVQETKVSKTTSVSPWKTQVKYDEAIVQLDPLQLY